MQDTDATRIWRKRVAQWRRSGLTAEQFCAREGLASNTLRHWSWRLGREQRDEGAEAIKFVKIEPPSRGRSGSLVVELGDASDRIRIESTIERSVLEMVIDVLDARRRAR